MSNVSLNTNFVKSIPLAVPDIKIQVEIADFVDQIIALKQEQYDELQKTFKLIQIEYRPKTMSKNLENFWKLSSPEFIVELEKQKVKIGLPQKRELIDFFENEKAKIQNLEQQIQHIDDQIEQKVRYLYELT